MLFGFDEKNRRRDGKELTKENTNKVKTILEFNNITNSITREYNYNNNVTVLRTKNVNSVTFSINGTTLSEPVLISVGDTLTVTIVKTVLGTPATVTIQEIIVP